MMMVLVVRTNGVCVSQCADNMNVVRSICACAFGLWVRAMVWERQWDTVKLIFVTNFVLCKTAVAVVRVDCGSTCKLLSVDNSSSGRVGLDDVPAIAYANAAFVTLFWRRRWRRLRLNNFHVFRTICVCFVVWVCVYECLYVWICRGWHIGQCVIGFWFCLFFGRVLVLYTGWLE